MKHPFDTAAHLCANMYSTDNDDQRVDGVIYDSVHRGFKSGAAHSATCEVVKEMREALNHLIVSLILGKFVDGQAAIDHAAGVVKNYDQLCSRLKEGTDAT